MECRELVKAETTKNKEYSQIMNYPYLANGNNNFCSILKSNYYMKKNKLPMVYLLYGPLFSCVSEKCLTQNILGNTLFSFL